MKLLSLTLLVLPCLAAADVRYTLAPEPAGRSVRVSVSVDPGAERVAFRIPAWCPGFYVIMNYQDKISDVRATGAAGKQLAVVSGGDKRQWIVQNPGKGPVTLSYRVLGDDPALGFFAVSVRDHTAFVNGPAAFMYAEGRKEQPVHLAITNPPGWAVATSLDRATNGGFRARDYDELLDHPIRLGIFERRAFTVEGVPFEAVFTSPNQEYKPDLDFEVKRMQALSVPALKMMGGAPFKRYVYHVHLAVGNFGGGLEHQASTVLAMPNKKPMDMDTLITHEFFHVWNVKHVRPKVLGPFDYTKEVRTDNLWFAEGVTDYYAHMHAYQSGLLGQDFLFDSLAGQISHLQSGKTRLEKSVAEASRAAWEGGSEGTGDLSYYNKGLVVGLLLDAAIRSRTSGAKSLDDVMRYLFARHRLPDKPGYEENGIILAINAVTGQNFSDLYNKMVYSTDELPYDVLQGIGMRAVLVGQQYKARGFSVEGAVVSSVAPAVRQLGLEPGDRVVSVDGKPFTPGVRVNSPDEYTIVVRREGEAMRFQLKPITLTATQIIFERDPFATPAAAALGDAWLQRVNGVK